MENRSGPKPLPIQIQETVNNIDGRMGEVFPTGGTDEERSHVEGLKAQVIAGILTPTEGWKKFEEYIGKRYGYH